MIIIGIAGKTLQKEEIKQLSNPNCSGVILFTRNYENRTQLEALCQEIRQVNKNLLICVDHEGGRVQRFRDEFTILPAMGSLGRLFQSRPLLAMRLTEAVGLILAYELRTVGIDFSFAPVLDLQDAQSTVIGDRAFSANPAEVSLLASALRQGMRRVGMAAVGKHFPGHGRVVGDSHHLLPRDERSAIEREADLLPFFAQIDDDIEAIMPAHILLPESDLPAGFSTYFIEKLRAANFRGAVISDDLDMNGAKVAGSARERVQAALSAGADAVLMCNNFAGIAEALAGNYQQQDAALSQSRLQALWGKPFSPAMTKTTERSLTALLFPPYLAARALLEKHTISLMA